MYNDKQFFKSLRFILSESVSSFSRRKLMSHIHAQSSRIATQVWKSKNFSDKYERYK